MTTYPERKAAAPDPKVDRTEPIENGRGWGGNNDTRTDVEKEDQLEKQTHDARLKEAKDRQIMKDTRVSVYAFSYTVGKQIAEYRVHVAARHEGAAREMLTQHLHGLGQHFKITSGTEVVSDVITEHTPVPPKRDVPKSEEEKNNEAGAVTESMAATDSEGRAIDSQGHLLGSNRSEKNEHLDKNERADKVAADHRKRA
jgi:hypothetical protein